MRRLSNELVIILVSAICLIGVAVGIRLSKDECGKYLIKTELSSYQCDNFHVYNKGISLTTTGNQVVIVQGHFEIILNKK